MNLVLLKKKKIKATSGGEQRQPREREKRQFKKCKLLERKRAAHPRGLSVTLSFSSLGDRTLPKQAHTHQPANVCAEGSEMEERVRRGWIEFNEDL